MVDGAELGREEVGILSKPIVILETDILHDRVKLRGKDGQEAWVEVDRLHDQLSRGEYIYAD